MRKLLLVIQGDYVAPRFDLATEIIIARYEKQIIIGEPKNIIMERPSDEGLSQMIVEEQITDLVCGGIEELHYKFLVWKKVNVIDCVIGGWQEALNRHVQNQLKHGDIIHDNTRRLSL